MFFLSWLVVDNVRYYNKYSALSANLMALIPVSCHFFSEESRLTGGNNRGQTTVSCFLYSSLPGQGTHR